MPPEDVLQEITSKEDYANLFNEAEYHVIMYTSKACGACKLFEKSLAKGIKVFRKSFPSVGLWKIYYRAGVVDFNAREINFVPYITVIVDGKEREVIDHYCDVEEFVKYLQVAIERQDL